MGNHSQLLDLSVYGSLSPLGELMDMLECEVLDLLCDDSKRKKTECQWSCSLIVAYQLCWNKVELF